MTETRRELTAPDGAYRFTFYQRSFVEDNARMYYTLIYKNRPVVEEGELGVQIENQLFESCLLYTSTYYLMVSSAVTQIIVQLFMALVWDLKEVVGI